MIFALKLTLVLHSGLQSVVLFIFHTFCVHTELFALNLCVRACVRVSMKSFTVCFFHTSSALSPHILKYIYVWMQNTCNFTHCKRVYTLYRRSSFNLSICFFSLLSSSSCVFFLHAFSLRHSESRTIHTHRTHTQGSLVGGGHGCSSSAQSQSGSRGSAASCLPASPGGIHSN